MLCQVANFLLIQAIHVLVSGGLGSSHGVAIFTRCELGGTSGGPEIGEQASVVGDPVSSLLGGGVVSCATCISLVSLMAVAGLLARSGILRLLFLSLMSV